MTETLFNDAASHLRIERFRARYLVAADHPAPERLKARLDDSITEWLPRSLGAALAASLPETAPDVWLIRRLRIDVDINVAWDRDVLVRVLAERVTMSLLATIRGGADGQEVVWFPDRAAYLAGFLSDRADGRGEAWYYESFAGLRPLPVSAALRTAICDRPETGLAALLGLSPEAVRRVVAALTASDARRVLDVLAVSAPAGDRARGLEAARSASAGFVNRPADGDEARDALRLYLAELTARNVAGPPLRDAARAVVRTDHFMGDAGPTDRGQLPGETAHGDLGSHGPGQTALTKAAVPERRGTPFGGAFFLFPMLDELPLDEATDGWPDGDGVSAAALARFLILVKCLGAPRAPATFRDSLLRDLMGIAPDVSGERLLQWQTSLFARDRSRFLETLETWHADRGALALERQFLVLVRLEDRPLAVLIDGARGLWRGIIPEPQGRPAGVVRRLRPLLNLVRPGSDFLCDPVYAGPLGTDFPDHRVTALGDVGSGDEPEVRDFVTRLYHPANDLSYLDFPPQLGIAGALDRALSVAAQGVLRSFAWRLPGFSRSSLSFLHANFLYVPATLEEQPDRRVVRLGSPPLGVVLNMTGKSRDTYRLSWLDDSPLALFPES
jgi:hypothetical protein